METTTQTPPATQTPQDAPTNQLGQSAAESKPAPVAPRDFRSQLSRTGSPGFRIGLVIGVIVLVIAGIFITRYLGSYESTDDAQIDGHINSISARVSGHVVRLNVEDNQFVQPGTVLVEIDPADYEVAVDSAQADFADARAKATAAGTDVPITSVNTSSQLSSTQAGADSARAGIQEAKQQADAAKAQLQVAEANNVKAQNDLLRYKQLVDKQEISQQQYDQAVAAAAGSQAAVRAAQANAAAAVQQITEAQGKLTQAEAERHNADTAPQQVTAMRAKAASATAEAQAKAAALEQAKLNLQYTKIAAPVAGMVSNRSVEVGQNVAPGQELMKIIPLDDIWITANLKETQLKNLRVGDPVTIAVDATGKKYNGKVDSIAGASGSRFSLLPPENATGNYVKVVQRIPVKIVLDPGENQNHELRPGMSVAPKIWFRK